MATSFKLRLFLMGMVALVPNEKDGTLMIVLPAAEHHTPILTCAAEGECELSDCDQRKEIADKIDQGDSGKPLKGYLLAGETLGLEANIPGGVKFVDDRWEPNLFHGIWGAVPRTVGTAEDISWMPSVGVIASDLWLNPGRYNVAALSRLEAQAVVKCYHLAATTERRVHSMTMRVKGGLFLPLWARRQALCDIAVVEIRARGSATFTLSTFGSDSKRTMTVKPEKVSGIADVLLANITPIEQLDHQSSIADHFQLYYKLLSAGSKKVRVPHLGARDVPSEWVNPDCLPSVIEVTMSSDHEDGHSGLSRPLCTVATFSE